MRSAGNARNSGFSLIELLVALTILGGLMAVTYSGFRVALTMWEKGNQRVETLAEQQTTLTVLREQIRGAMPLSYVGSELLPQQHLAFEGQSNRLRLVSRLSWRDGASAPPHWVELTWDKSLTIEEKQIIPPSNLANENPFWHTELQVFEEVEFSYLVRTTPDRLAEWVQSWDPTERREMPVAVRLKYKIQDQWYGLLIPLDYAEASWKGQMIQ